MLTPEQLEALPYSLIKKYRKLEDYILEDISRRIAKAGTITDTAEWQIIRLKELGEANDVIKNKIAEITKLSEKEVDSLFFDSAQMSTDFYKSVYEKTGAEFTPFLENKSMVQHVSSLIKQTNSELYNFTQSMGFATVVNGKTVFKPMAKVYQDTLDFAQMQVSSGAVDYITAIKQATSKLADSGLRFVDYKTGWVNRSDVAVRRAVLTGVGQVTGKISEQVMNDLETDIVEVTAHAGARPDHAEWQGKWYSFSGKSDKYPSLVAVTHYGEGDGLKGYNCRHDYYPVIPDISEPAYTANDLKNIGGEPFEYEGKTYTQYEASQFQRKIETAMRKTKREIIVADASGNKADFTAKSILLRRQKDLYAEFSKKANLKTQLERTQVLDFDRSKAQKAIQAYKKTVDNKVKGGMMHDKDIINQAKASEIFNSSGISSSSTVTAEQICENMKSSKIGKEYLQYAENLPERIKLDYETYMPTLYGENQGNSITIYMRSNLTAERASRTIIHECTHYRYGIGESQWSESVCVAHELMHKRNRKTLTMVEKRNIIKAVKDAYDDKNWRRGGIINGRRKSH